MVTGKDRVRAGKVGRGPVTVCKICGTSIFDTDLRSWVRTPIPGLAHERCSAITAKP